VIIPIIRRAGAADLDAIAAIQDAAGEAAQWDVRDYLRYDLRVAVCSEQIAGFLVCRAIDASECEILNLAVAPDFRRRGVGRALVRSLLDEFRGAVFLEVRASNRAAFDLYQSLGFQVLGERPEYYICPLETAIVMKFHSC
jgi:ribosomal-protein-alanine N-acetyltransferase